MALLAMAVYCTEQNNRDAFFKKTLEGLQKTVDFSKHELGISINGYTNDTLLTIAHFKDIMRYRFWNEQNIGTAEAVNLIIKMRTSGQHVIKMDDDIYIHSEGWVDELEEVAAIDPSIGQVALKRKDLWENVNHENEYYRTKLYQLPHSAGQRWIITEITNHCIGSCVLHSSALLDKVGFLKQPSTYGLDDSLMSKRSHIAGFKNVFLSHIVIDHLDNSPPKDWQAEKERIVSESWNGYNLLLNQYEDNPKSIYYNPYETKGINQLQ